MPRLARLPCGFVLPLLAAWPVAVWVIERAPGYSGPEAPGCGAFSVPSYAGAARRARIQVQAMMGERQIPAMSAAVSVRGETVWREGFGYADLEARAKACPDTLFRAASVSKTFTAAGMGRLIDAGRLDPDAPIQRYVPSFPDKGRPVTARLLASHRAGIRPYRDDSEAVNRKEYRSVTDSLAQFREDPLAAVPGARFIYSNYGYVLLSAAMEGASGQGFLSYMNQSVFAPLGMNSTTEDRAGTDLPRRASFYDHVTPYSPDGRRVLSPPNNYGGRWASGGYLTTAGDLIRFGSAHLPGQRSAFLSPATLEMLMRPQSGMPPVAGYGSGWITARDLHGRRVHFHFGAGSGATAVLAIWPGSQVVVALMGNLGHARLPFRRLAGVVNPFLRGPQPDRVAGAAALAAAVLWTGFRYRHFRRRR
jgi:CubicO group peptidase (beta-lactamase class C family)